MIDLSFLTNLCEPMVFAFCLIVGFILKHWIDDVDNKYIPTILVVLGIWASCLTNHAVTLDLIVSGAFSALASTGMHQTFKQLIEKK
jgi:hypothetical protein